MSLDLRTPDRRRRMLAIDPAVPDEELTLPGISSGSPNDSSGAFAGLSRDRLIRRIISPRRWKVVSIASLLISIPVLFPIANMEWCFNGRLGFLEHSGLLTAGCGIQVMLAAQLCFLIACIRSASTVDFRGGYRGWKWLCGFLATACLFLLSRAASVGSQSLAESAQQLIGPVSAARPVLMIVPATALLAVILRVVLPDMGRFRLSQGLMVTAVGCFVASILIHNRSNELWDGILPTFQLLTSGMLLSAVLLHAHFVIYVNPDPPGSDRELTTRTTAPANTESSLIALPVAAEKTASDSLLAATKTADSHESANANPELPAAVTIPELHAEAAMGISTESPDSTRKQPTGARRQRRKAS